MFEIKSENANEWKAIVTTIQTLVEEATFNVSASSLDFRAMDPSHVALIDLEWPSSGFEKFECDKPDKFALSVKDFGDIIKRADKRDTLSLKREDSESLLIGIGDHKKFELHLIESGSLSTPLPNLGDFPTKFSIIASAFDRFITDVSTVANHLTIEADKDSFVKFSGKGDTGKASIGLTQLDIPEFESKEYSKATYSIEYLTKIVKPLSQLSDILTLEMKSKMPLRISATFCEKKGRLTFYLAPRVQE